MKLESNKEIKKLSLTSIKKIQLIILVAVCCLIFIVMICYPSNDINHIVAQEEITSPENVSVVKGILDETPPNVNETTTTEVTTEATTTTPAETTTPQSSIPYQEPYIRNNKAIVQEYTQYEPNVVGWLNVDGTAINYPVVQCEDNEYYLDRDTWGNYSSAGAVFLDFRSLMGDNENKATYAHNMGNGSMFGTLKRYKSYDFWAKNQYINLSSSTHDYTYQIFSAILCNSEYGYFDYWNYIVHSSYDFNYFNDAIKAHEYYSTGIEISPDDTILMLSTCNSGANDGWKLVVFAKLIMTE